MEIVVALMNQCQNEEKFEVKHFDLDRFKFWGHNSIEAASRL